MNAYSLTKLAQDAGVSVNVVRNYMTQGLLRPSARTKGGFGIFDDKALSRLRLVRSAFEAGLARAEVAALCKALDEGSTDAGKMSDRLCCRIQQRRCALASVEAQLELITRSAAPPPVTRDIYAAV